MMLQQRLIRDGGKSNTGMDNRREKTDRGQGEGDISRLNRVEIERKTGEGLRL